jgi:hypothetical protein
VSRNTAHSAHEQKTETPPPTTHCDGGGLDKKIRKVLFQVTLISLALDESKHRSIIRLRADISRAQSSGSRWRHVSVSHHGHAWRRHVIPCWQH